MRRISAKTVVVAIAALLCAHKSGLDARAVGLGDDPRVAQRTVLSGRVIDSATNEPIITVFGRPSPYTPSSAAVSNDKYIKTAM